MEAVEHAPDASLTFWFSPSSDGEREQLVSGSIKAKRIVT
jgi:hypothetical protein